MVAFGTFTTAQEVRNPIPLTARDNPRAVSAQPDSKQTSSRTSSNLPFCPPKTCLYYAGDFDSSDSNANGLLNTNYNNGKNYGQVYVGVKPSKTAIVTGVTFNQLFIAGFTGTNPTPFQTQIGIVQGAGGTVVCNTTGNATLKRYGESDFGLVQYSYTVKRLAKTCRMQDGSKGTTYVSLLPTSSTGYGYLADVEDPKPRNHRGWKDDVDDSYFNGSEYAYQPTWGSDGVCQLGCDLFSIALTGKK
jgi:hypothetical protein